jgi:ubiquinone/menaquinone biosynthesis C-methylase UbiE
MPGPHPPGDSVYIHGTHPEEQHRLSRLNDLLNAACLRELAPPPGARVLDVGSGLGQFSRAIARVVGLDGRVVGVERDPAQLARARDFAATAGETALVDFREGDATAPPLRDDEWGTFDLVHTRFVLEHVRDPLAVVRQMARAARPGGRIVLADDDHEILRLHPELPGFDEIWRAYYNSYRAIGNDPLIGRRLPQLLHEAGLRPWRITWVFFGACAGEAEFPAFLDNLAGVVEGATDAMTRRGGISAAGIAQILADFRAWGRRPDAAIWYGLNWAEGLKPAGSV